MKKTMVLEFPTKIIEDGNDGPATDVEDGFEDDVKVDFIDDCTVMRTANSSTRFDLIRQIAFGAKRTNGRTFSAMFYVFVDTLAEQFEESPDDPKFRIRTLEGAAEDFREAIRSFRQ